MGRRRQNNGRSDASFDNGANDDDDDESVSSAGESKESKIETLKAIKLRKQIIMVLNQGRATLEKSKRKGEDTISSIASLCTVSDQIKEAIKNVNQFIPINPSFYLFVFSN